jgi:hypothetical protein
MKTTIVLAALLAAATPAFAQYGPGPSYGSPYNNGEQPDWRLAPNQGTMGQNCRMVITHRTGPNGSITVRRRICD